MPVAETKLEIERRRAREKRFKRERKRFQNGTRVSSYVLNRRMEVQKRKQANEEERAKAQRETESAKNETAELESARRKTARPGFWGFFGRLCNYRSAVHR